MNNEQLTLDPREPFSMTDFRTVYAIVRLKPERQQHTHHHLPAYTVQFALMDYVGCALLSEDEKSYLDEAEISE